MHDTAFQIAGKFFQLYWKPDNQLIVELGACSINGSLRDHQPAGSRYIGLDIEPGPSVDVVIENSLNLPFADSEADCVISSSTFEHDKFFWQTFLELCRITKPGGFIYLNSPSNGEFHRYPSDYWRFYPDAGRGLEEWATTSGIKVTLVESFVAARIGDQWNDFVAIFQRGEAESRKDDDFLCNHFACQNVHRFNVEQIKVFEPRTQDMQLLAEAQASAEQVVGLKGQLSDLHQQVNKLYQVAIQHEPLQQAHIVLQKENENNFRLLAARDETLTLSKAATAQLLVDRERERSSVEKLTARVHELTSELHSIQQDASSVTRELAAQERDFAGKLAANERTLTAQMQAMQQQAATRERDFAEKLAASKRELIAQLQATQQQSAAREQDFAEQLSAKERELTAQLHSAQQQLTTRERDFAEELAAKKRELTAQLHSVQQQQTTRERDFAEELAAKKRELTAQLHSAQQQLTTRERDFAKELAAKERELNAQLYQLHRELFGEAEKVATRERETAEKFLSRESALETQLSALRLEAVQLSQAVRDREATISSLNQAATVHGDQTSTLKKHVESLTALAAVGEEHRHTLNRVVAERDAQIMQIGRIVAERDSRIAELSEELRAIYHAISWRLTTPLRKVRSWFGAKNAYDKAATTREPGDSLPLASIPAYSSEPLMAHKIPTVPTPLLYQDRKVVAAANTLMDLLQDDELLFVERTYQTLLKRPPDSQGLIYYLTRLLNGSPKIQILSEISESSEARSLAVRLPGLPGAIKRYRMANAPIIGAIAGLFLNVESNSLSENRLRAIEQQLFTNRRYFDERVSRLETALEVLKSEFLANREARRNFEHEPAGTKAPLLEEHEIEKRKQPLISPVDARSINILTSSKPLVSVIIPIYGKIEYTLRCLASIAANSPQAPFEVIVVDDCSPDNSVEVLFSINGLRLIRSEKNQGFVRSCNVGAKAANGEYLYFLNNDTQVTPGWADELLRTFEVFPGTGLAGSKLIYPDGRLQEAGGIIWQDGSAWNFGRFQDPLLPIYNYAREVDYCSGASIMVPKALFEELGGFDEHYLPAYCEDSDLALKIRAKHYRVIYQPMSTVIHYEGITSGTDTSQGTKAYQVQNAKKLFARWKDHLSTHQSNGVDVDNAKDRGIKRRALVLEHCTLTPNQDAGSVTVFNLLLLLREMGFQVTFIPEDNFLYMPEYTTALQRVGIEVLYAPYVTSVEQHLKEYGNRYDLAFLFRPGVIKRHLETVRALCPKARVLYHTVDLHFLRMAREAKLQSNEAKQMAAEEMKLHELAAIRGADAAIVHSTEEIRILRTELPTAKLHVFPLIMDVKGTEKAFEDRSNIVFIGGYQHTPNVDAVQYFVASIMPLLRKRLPGVRFYAVGSKPPATIQALESDDVIITGFVNDLDSLLDKMRVSVAPLRYGAGIKGKIGSAMAVGLPVVATSLAVEGMSLTDGQNIIVADGAKNIADAVVMLYKDESLWNRISFSGLEFASQAWGADASWRTLAGIAADLGFQSTRSLRKLTLYTSKLSVAPPSLNDGQH
jgi:GT2 family glycosyltransferase/SAM-dependent methyltransferase